MDGHFSSEFASLITLLREEVKQLREASKEALTGIKEAQQAGFHGLNTRLDLLNGQTRRHGETLAAVQSRIAANEDRITKSEAAFDDQRTLCFQLHSSQSTPVEATLTKRNAGILAGVAAVAGSVAAVLIEIIKFASASIK